jgi:hypothetical protein
VGVRLPHCLIAERSEIEEHAHIRRIRVDEMKPMD